MSLRAVLAGLALVLVAASAIAVARGTGRDELPPRLATERSFGAIRAELTEQRVELEFLLLHARLETPRELGDQLDALADGAAEQAAALAATDPPPSIAGLVAVLRDELAEQGRALRTVARAARRSGPPAVRAAEAALLARKQRIVVARQRLERSFQIGS